MTSRARRHRHLRRDHLSGRPALPRRARPLRPPRNGPHDLPAVHHRRHPHRLRDGAAPRSEWSVAVDVRPGRGDGRGPAGRRPVRPAEPSVPRPPRPGGPGARLPGAGCARRTRSSRSWTRSCRRPPRRRHRRRCVSCSARASAPVSSSGSSWRSMNALVGVGAVIYYSTDVFRAAGIGGTNGAEFASLAVGGVNFLAAVVSVFLTDRFGRRPLLSIGLVGIALCLAVAGIILVGPGAEQGGLLRRRRSSATWRSSRSPPGRWRGCSCPRCFRAASAPAPRRSPPPPTGGRTS